MGGHDDKASGNKLLNIYGKGIMGIIPNTEHDHLPALIGGCRDALNVSITLYRKENQVSQVTHN